MIETLEELGFSTNAARVYIALLETGTTTISKLVEKTSLHPQLIYNALEELEKQELSSYTVERGRRYFQAGPPKTLVQLQKQKLGKIEEILPQLMTKYQKGEQPMVFVYSGNEEFQKARARVINSIPSGGCYYVIGSGGKPFLQAMEGTYREEEEKRIKRGVHKRVIDFKDTREYNDPFPEDTALSQYRYLSGMEGGPTSTLFGGEYLRINIWSHPVLTILIKNKVLVESYKKYFEILWLQAEKIGR